MGQGLKQGNDFVQIETRELLSPMEIDAIGEILNISMGSAATAISTMLDKQVLITTPKVSIKMLDDIDFTMMEPAMIVKITYVEGVTGSNVMVFRQTDMQMILNQLMGIDEPPKPDFIFDELSMSAACEVMNQMMGAAATALSEFLGRTVNISPPTATVMDHDHSFQSSIGVDGNEDIVSVVFDLSIKDIMKSEFVSVMTCDLAKMIVRQFMHEEDVDVLNELPQPKGVPANPYAGQHDLPQAAGRSQTSEGNHISPVMPPQGTVPQAAFYPPYPAYAPLYQEQPFLQPFPPEYQQAHPGYTPGLMQPLPPNYPPQASQTILKQPVNVQNVQFPTFPQHKSLSGVPITGGNMDLIMNVPLSVSVEIGKTKKKIKDIMEFCQGTVIELEKQAGAPVDIVVNGQLFARGDVVVIDDNFGVRVTEIIGTNELINTVSANKG